MKLETIFTLPVLLAKCVNLSARGVIMFSILLIASLLGLGACELSVVTNCPYGLIRDDYLQVFGDKCYKFNLNSKKDWKDANEDCGDVGGFLAMPKTKEIEDFLVKAIRDTYKAVEPVWIGLTDMAVEGTFRWADGTVLNTTTDFKDFARFEGPRESLIESSVEDCVAIDPTEDSKWYDYYCQTYFFSLFNAHKNYVCEYDLINVPTTPAPTTPTTPTTPATTKCPPYNCDKDCRLTGFQVDDKGCTICECDY